MKYGYKETRRLGTAELRSLCIDHQWYTAGTVEEYCHLFDMVSDYENITSDEWFEKQGFKLEEVN